VTHPFVSTLDAAIVQIATQQLPAGYAVSQHAPADYQTLKAHLDAGRKMVVWSGGSDATIYGSRSVNYAFRAWHDLCHWRGAFDFSLDGEIATCDMQCTQLLRFAGSSEQALLWCSVVRAEVIGQAFFLRRYGRFPADQRAFVAAYLHDPQRALRHPRW
jgi:hypothetical protein